MTLDTKHNKKMNTKLNVSIDLITGLLDALTKSEATVIAMKAATDCTPFGHLKLSVKESPAGVMVKVSVGGSPGESEAIISNVSQTDKFIYTVIDMLESSGNGTSNGNLAEIRTVITEAWRAWYGKYVILQGCSPTEVAKRGCFSKSPDWGIANKEATNDEIPHRSPKSYHDLAMLDCDPETFTHKGKVVLAYGLNIGDAIQALEDGYDVTCEHWPKEVYLFMHTSTYFEDFIAMHTSQGDNTPWSPTQKSLVDRTWCILA